MAQVTAPADAKAQDNHGYAAGFPHGLPVRLSYTSRKFPPPSGAGARCARPRSARFEPVAQVKDIKRRFLAYSFPPRSPNPPHLAVLRRPGFVRAAPALPATTRIRLPHSYSSLLRVGDGRSRRSLTSTRTNSASRCKRKVCQNQNSAAVDTRCPPERWSGCVNAAMTGTETGGNNDALRAASGS